MRTRPSVAVPEKISFAEPLSSQNVFLTGATGVLGANLMKEILTSTDSRLFCLVRADCTSSARERLHSFLRIYDPDDILAEEFSRRVTPVVGNITHETLELSEAEYEELAGTIDATIHAAAFTSLFANYRRIAPINVEGARNIIRFAMRTRQRYLCHISTYTVMGDRSFDQSLVFREKDLDIGQTFKHMTYQETKFIAENMLWQAAQEGLVCNIFRPGQIFGESISGLYPQGQTNVSGLFYDMLKTVMETGVALHCGMNYDVTPVDYVSKALVSLGLQRNSYLETYHLTNPDTTTYADFISLVRALGYEIKGVPQEEYERIILGGLLEVNGVEYRSYSTKAFRWWFQRSAFDFNESAETDCSYTQQALEPFGLRCPQVDRDLLRTYVSAGIQQSYFPPPATTTLQ